MDAKPGQSFDRVDTSGMVARINPREEWQNVYTDTWRIFRDFFYEPGMHGVDWRAVYDQYFAMLKDAVNRHDVTHISKEMISELNIGHAYYSGGDLESASPVRVGHLGAEYEFVEDGSDQAYRITRILKGGPWDTDARGPLSEPGIKVEEGEYLLAINGELLTRIYTPYAALEAQGGRLVELTINDEPEMNDDARTVVVRALRNDNNLRYRAWVERNRQYVKEQSGGRVGYIYVPNTGVDGQNELIRQFTSQKHKDALIIDERWNGGGQIPTRFVEVLDRPISSFFALRHGNPWVVPDYAHHGPKAMLINGRSGSGGDMFPFLFRQAGLGPLIGQRTWGGLVGISYNPHVVDLAFLAVPRFAFYELDGTWGIEGFGVAPDIPVTADPALLAGDTGRTEVLRDPQLDRAIKEMLDELDRNPPVKVVPPPKGPNRSGMGIDPRDR
ncbi:MAG: PDZ domain-containing protein [Planctomycetota bacterium]